MKLFVWGVSACLSGLLAGCPQVELASNRDVVATGPDKARQSPAGVSQWDALSGVTLTLDTRPVNVGITHGERYAITLSGRWTRDASAAIYLQASDSAGNFLAPAITPPASKQPFYRLTMPLPPTTPAGLYTGVLSVRACADALCENPYPGTTHGIAYTVRVNALEDWGTLQGNARHDGYVPVEINPRRFQTAWTWGAPAPRWISPIVTHAGNVYFSATVPAELPSIRALRAADGAALWRHDFTAPAGRDFILNPPSVSGGIVYAATTGQQNRLHALRGSDGVEMYRSPEFFGLLKATLNPTVHKDKVYVNSGYTTGIVFAFNVSDGSIAWNAGGGTYAVNTPAVDDDRVYAFDGTTLDVLNAEDGALSVRIGPAPDDKWIEYGGTPMLGSPDHVLVLMGVGGPGFNYAAGAQRPLANYSIAEQRMRWISSRLYRAYPAVAKGVVYATSNESRTLDLLDEATGRLKWSWQPPEQYPTFVGNILVTDNVAFLSTATTLYAIDLRARRAVWSAATPGMVSLSADRMLFASSLDPFYHVPTRITAYKLD